MTKGLKSLSVFGLFLFATAVASAQPEAISVDTRDSLSANNTAVNLTGAVLCPAGQTFSVTAIVQQAHANVSTVGQNFSAPNIDCTGVPQPFSALVQVIIPPGGQFKKGPASLILSVSTEDSTPSFTGDRKSTRLNSS